MKPKRSAHLAAQQQLARDDLWVKNGASNMKNNKTLSHENVTNGVWAWEYLVGLRK